jgi:hypothetical protein
MTLTRETVEKLVKRLDAIYASEENGPLCHEAAAAILDAWDERDALQNAQTYSYIGRDGKTVLARDLEDRAEAAEAKLAERAAALEDAVAYAENLRDYGGA